MEQSLERTLKYRAIEISSSTADSGDVPGVDTCGTSPGPDHRNRDQKMKLSRDQTGTGTKIKMPNYLIYKTLPVFTSPQL